MEQENGFFASLFDFSFSEFLTVKIIKLLYGLGILFAGIVSIGMLVKGIGIMELILSPLFFFIFVILLRVWLEMIIVLFRIADNTRDIAKQGQQQEV